jgi:ankyrin repeat protein
MLAIFRKMSKAIKLIIPYSELSACDFNKNTPFIAAAANGDIETLELLLNR